MTFPDTHNYGQLSSDDNNAAGAGGNLGESFIATPSIDTPSSEAIPYLEVVSPATLPEVRCAFRLYVCL